MTLIDASLRRSLLPPAAPAVFMADHARLSTLAINGFTYRLLETSIDRALDLVRAAVMHREQLGAGQMIYDATTDTLPLSAFTASIAPAPAAPAAASDGAVSAGDVIVADEEEEDNPVVAATESVIAALASARTVYASVVAGLVSLSVQRVNFMLDAGRDASEADLEGLGVASISLFKRIQRGYLGCEAWFLGSGLNVVLRVDDRVELAVSALVGGARGVGARSQPSALESAWIRSASSQ